MAKGKYGREAVLSAVIDPLLLEGGRTVREIALTLEPQFAGKYTIEKIINNVRSRIVVLQSRGYKLEKGADKKVRLVLPQPTETATA